MTSIRRLASSDTLALALLRRRALEDAPLAFAASLEDDRALSLDFVAKMLDDTQEQAVFGCCDGSDLTGMVGLLRDAKVKRRHKAGIWGMYVLPSTRRKGIARALLQAAIEQARAWRVEQLHLSVSVAAAEAKRLYESAGFIAWGREPRALAWNGEHVDEDHFVLDLRA
jgi:ribosomal protein S18 acetylase RimI-like enzyme